MASLITGKNGSPNVSGATGLLPVGNGGSGRTTPSTTNTIAFVGDSRLAQVYVDPGMLSYNAVNFYGQANAMLNASMRLVYQGAVSGDRSDQYLVFLPGALSSGARFMVIGAVVNDISQGFTTLQAWNGYNGSVGIKAACDMAIAAGMRPILMGEFGATSFTGNATAMGYVHQYNNLAREYVETHPSALYLNTPAALLDPTSAGVAFKTGYSSDGVHTITLGAYAMGQAFAALLSPQIVTFDKAISSGNEAFANGAIQQLPNPLLLTATGGTVNSPATGTTPSGVTLSCDSGLTCAASVVAGAFGNEIVLTMTATGAQTFTAAWALTASRPVVGDIYQAGAEVTVDNGSSNFNGAYLQTTVVWGGFTQSINARACYNDASSGPGPTTAYTQVLLTNPMTVTTTPLNEWDFIITGRFTGSGSATVRIRRPWLRKLN